MSDPQTNFEAPPSSENLCGICGKNRAHHTSDAVFHEFSAEGRLVSKGARSSQRTSARPQGSSGSSLTADPVLRLALIRNGAVKPEELEAIEAELRVSGVAYANPNTRTGDENGRDRPGESPG